MYDKGQPPEYPDLSPKSHTGAILMEIENLMTPGSTLSILMISLRV